MNSGRKVIAKKKDRSTFPTFLSVSEANLGENEHFFVGMMKDLSTVKSAEAVRMHDFSLLDGILDVAIVINEAGTIQFFNKSAEKLLGYERMEVLGKNVNMLMPPPFHDEHDTYLRNYLTTGVAKVLGTGRDVLAQCKDGKILQVHLSITEQGVTGEKRFTGILRPTVEKKGVEKSVLQEEREVLDNLLVAAIIIDSNALIHGFNQPASALLGYSLIEVVGKNVKMFMANPEKSKHDTYVQNYLKGGRPKVLGKGRDVVAVHKDGTMIPVHLSVTERREEDKRYFTGILQKL
jgi:two-component system sensor kinase FixL